jgi:DNA-binding response OmpR family regulator
MNTHGKLLVVDDDRDLLQGLGIRLKASGYEVVFAADGVQAIAAARKEKPDLILLDIGLPGGDGYVVMERLRMMSSSGPIPVIVLSAKDPQVHRERSLKAGASHFFQKPLDNAALLAAIRSILGEASVA